jgi:hypothetical protein
VSNVLFCFCCIAAQKVPTAKHGCGIEIELRFFALKPTSLRKHTTWLYMYERNKIHNVHLLSKRTSVPLVWGISVWLHVKHNFLHLLLHVMGNNLLTVIIDGSS